MRWLTSPGVGSPATFPGDVSHRDRKSTRLNSSHSQISYAVFCLKKKKATLDVHPRQRRRRVSDVCLVLTLFPCPPIRVLSCMHRVLRVIDSLPHLPREAVCVVL